MKRIIVLLLISLVATCCSPTGVPRAQTSISQITVTPPQVSATPKILNTLNEIGKATKITSVYSAWNVGWLPDGRIWCGDCNMTEDGNYFREGVIDPSDDSFSFRLPHYLLTDEEATLFSNNGEEIYNHLISPSKNNYLVVTRKPNNSFDFDYFAYYYSRANREIKPIPLTSLKDCGGTLDRFFDWNDNERFVLADCWLTYDEAKTTYLFDLQDLSFIDLREIIRSKDVVKAALSRDGSKLAIYNLNDQLFIYDISDYPQKILKEEILVSYLNEIEWSQDGKWIYLDNIKDQKRTLNRINLETLQEQLIFDYQSIESATPGIQIRNFSGSWILSPDSKSILLIDSGLWVFHIK